MTKEKKEKKRGKLPTKEPPPVVSSSFLWAYEWLRQFTHTEQPSSKTEINHQHINKKKLELMITRVISIRNKKFLKKNEQ